MRIIAVVNQKGGVGKTTTSVNLGAALALRGRRVLLVDLDPQGNLTDHLLGDPAEGVERASIYDVLVEGKPILDALVEAGTPGLFVLPSHEDLAGAELDLASVIGREVLLRDALADVPDGTFDYILLDCPPSLGLLSLNALAAAHEVFIALQTEFFAMRGLGALDRTVDLVKRRINPALRVTGIVPTLVDATRLSREVVDEVRGHYGELVFASRVRSNIRLAEAPSHGKHIFEYAPDSPGAADYAALAKEVEEGRDAVEVPTEGSFVAPRATGATAVTAPPGVQGAPTPAPQSAGPRLRGIARAIQEATADVVAGAGLPRPAPRPAPGARGGTVAGTHPPSVTSPHSVATPPVRASFGPESPPSSATVAPPVAPTHPSPTPPPTRPGTPAPVRRPPVPLPVLRSGPRPLSLPPMPTRPPSAVPRPATLPRPPRPVGS